MLHGEVTRVQQRRTVRNRSARRRARARGGLAPVMGRLFAVYLALALTAGVVVIGLRANRENAVPASTSSSAQGGSQGAGGGRLSIVERLKDAAYHVLDLVRPASARNTGAPSSSDEDRMRSFGDMLIRAALDTMGGLDPEDPRTMIRAELPVLMEPEIPAVSGTLRAGAVAARSVASGGRQDLLEASAVPVEPWVAATSDASGAPTSLAAPAAQSAQSPSANSTALAASAATSPVAPASVVPPAQSVSPASPASTAGSAELSISAAEPAAATSAVSAKQATASAAGSNRATSTSSTRAAKAQAGPQVAVLHTHSSEAYRASQGSDYRWGKTDGVVQVGAVLAEELKKAGVEVIHSTKVHDYPNWTKSYASAATTISSILKDAPDIQAIIDVHRDAVPADSASLKPVTIAGQKCARVIFIVSNESSGLAHPNWRANYAFALKVSAALDKVAPGLSRGVAIHKGGRFNQQMHDHAIIVEIGGTTNTLEEATRSARYVARAIAAVL
jgi:stage II sporulation protein P